MLPMTAEPAKILVIDDEVDVLEVLRLVLSRSGYQVAASVSGIEGLAHAQSERPDLVLLDIMMQRMDGWEVLRALKSDETTRDIPVVILSARVEPKDKIRGLQEGAVDYVTKPFAVREILEKVAAILGAAGDGSETASGSPA
jgi:DNA-binding response OmpR family regulator